MIIETGTNLNAKTILDYFYLGFYIYYVGGGGPVKMTNLVRCDSFGS